MPHSGLLPAARDRIAAGLLAAAAGGLFLPMVSTALAITALFFAAIGAASFFAGFTGAALTGFFAGAFAGLAALFTGADFFGFLLDLVDADLDFALFLAIF